MLLVDLTQIINDFRLFSEFQQGYKRSLPDPSLFTFVEVGLSGAPLVQLQFNGKLAEGYTHVKLGWPQSDDMQIQQFEQEILNGLISPSDYQE